MKMAGDEVQHDRRHHLVGTGPRLERAGDESPRRPGEDSRRRRRPGWRRSGAKPATSAPTAAAPRAPIRNWPCAPMLKSPALKPRPTAMPPRISGVAARIVNADPTDAAERPFEQVRVRLERQEQVERPLEQAREDDDDRAHDEPARDGGERDDRHAAGARPGLRRGRRAGAPAVPAAAVTKPAPGRRSCSSWRRG